jgi:7,8-dihydropterin-6-yl-methyl-4-(beta-D-ribofuranosyl)aminobenzene 5'-phosphate synthase
MTPPPAPALDELTITIVVDNATDTLSSIPTGVPQLPELAYLLGGIPPIGQHDGHDCVVGFDHLCVACHGFSALATARRGDRTATVLFDVGPYGDVWLANAERLSLDLSTIDVLFLSHWHWDHSGALATVVATIATARRRAGRPPLVVDVHPDRPDQRGILTPLDVFAMLPPEPTLDAIASAGGQIVTSADVHVVADLLLSSGDIPRLTPYETGLTGHHTWRGDQVISDPEIHDERFLAAKVRGRGTTVLTACSHAGVVNVGLEAHRGGSIRRRRLQRPPSGRARGDHRQGRARRAALRLQGDPDQFPGDGLYAVAHGAVVVRGEHTGRQHLSVHAVPELVVLARRCGGHAVGEQHRAPMGLGHDEAHLPRGTQHLDGVGAGVGHDRGELLGPVGPPFCADGHGPGGGHDRQHRSGGQRRRPPAAPGRLDRALGWNLSGPGDICEHPLAQVGRGLDRRRPAQACRGGAEAFDLGGALRAAAQVLLELRTLLGGERVDHVGADESVWIGGHAYTSSASRSLIMPSRIRVFTVPSGRLRMSATSA